MAKYLLLFMFSATCLRTVAQERRAEDIFFIDTHNDVLSKVVSNDLGAREMGADAGFDFAKAAKGNLVAQVFSVWCDESLTNDKAYARACEEIDSLMALVRRNKRSMVLVKNSGDLKKALRHKKFAAMIGVEGGHMIAGRLDLLDSLISRGMKYLTLTWNNSTGWATSARDETLKRDSLPHLGLDAMGREVVTRLNNAGVMVDISHAGEQTFRDVLAITTKPVIASHSCAWALAAHRRNLKDDQLRAIGRNGGVVFVNFFSGFLDSSYENRKLEFVSRHRQELDSISRYIAEPDLAVFRLFALHRQETDSLRPPLGTLVDHIDYIARMIGVDHVGIGSDFDGAESFPLEMDDISCYPKIASELAHRGYSKTDIQKIAGGNFIRVLKENE
jgi:membrane dipeptidase